MGNRTIETLYSVEAAAKKLGGISKFTVYAWMSRGKLERTKVGGRTMIRALGKAGSSSRRAITPSPSPAGFSDKNAKICSVTGLHTGN
jgi:hypothetical protein